MALLLEGMTLVFENSTIEDKHRKDCMNLFPNGTIDHIAPMERSLDYHFLRLMMG